MSDSFITVEFVNCAGGSVRNDTEILQGTTLNAFLETKLSQVDGKIVKVNNVVIEGHNFDEVVLKDLDQVRVTAANIKGAA